MTLIAFLGHTTCSLRSSWPLPRWRSVASTRNRVHQ